MNSSSLTTPSNAKRASLSDALAWIDANLAALGEENVALEMALGRIAARDIAAEMPLPPCDRASIDGFALRARASLGASIYNPLSFQVVAPTNSLAEFGAFRVAAGSALPAGCDAVVSLDCVQPSAAGCELVEPAAPGDNVERAGSHAGSGTVLVAAGRCLDPADIGSLAAAAFSSIPAIRRPMARLALAGGGVASVAAPLLQALIARDDAIVEALHIVDRSPDAIAALLAEPGADLIVVVGGTGPGSDDHAPAALAQAGELVFHGVAVRPGETTCIGRTARGVPVVLLPGTPIACLWSYEFFAGRALRRLGSRSPMPPFRQCKMTITRKLVSAIGLAEVFPVRFRDGLEAEPIASFGETGMVAASRADGFVIVPEGSEGVSPGAQVTVYLRAGVEWSQAHG